VSARRLPDELEELLTLHVLEGLGRDDERELRTQLARRPEIDARDWERGASGLHLALVAEDVEPLPAALSARLRADARSAFGAAASSARSAGKGSVPRSPWTSAWLAWGVAAAALLVLALQLGARGAPSLERQYAALVARADVVRSDWSAGDDPLARGVTGEVVWSPSEQRGFMRFKALARNDPRESQYQLWIFDGTRPAESPVDGGVFDVRGDDVLIPIDAKIDVRDAALFAVTVEQPGGVVVSKRERLLLTATVL
jgi:anti-sigma-K factor RskA